MVQESEKAAEELEKEGYSVEVIDLRTVQPIDIDTLVASVEKTGRAVVVQEAQRQAGVGATVAAELAERAILSLEHQSLVWLLLIQYIHLHKLKMFGYQTKTTSLKKLKQL